MRKNEDPRLSFSTPEFKEAQRTFTDGFKVEASLMQARRQEMVLVTPVLASVCNRCKGTYKRFLAEKLWKAGGMGSCKRLCLVNTTAPEIGSPCKHVLHTLNHAFESLSCTRDHAQRLFTRLPFSILRLVSTSCSMQSLPHGPPSFRHRWQSSTLLCFSKLAFRS